MNIKRIAWDIETSPNIAYTWRTGYKIQLSPENIIKERAIICICWKEIGKKKIHSLTWNNGDDREMIKEFLEVARTADELIAHNGDHFDLRWFKGQCIKYGFGDLGDVKTVDTCAIARRNFYLNSYKLDYLAQIWFGEKKIHTDYQLWKDVCDGSKKALAQMVQYCKKDVDLQEKVWNKLVPFYKPKVHSGALLNLERWTCPHDGSTNVYRDKKRATSAGNIRHQMKCNLCGRYFTIPNNVYLSFLEYKGNK